VTDRIVIAYLAGLVTAGYLACGGFFIRFWWRSRDFLLLAFALAFWLLALDAALVELLQTPEEQASWLYLLRVAAFVLIASAIVRKNAAASRN